MKVPIFLFLVCAFVVCLFGAVSARVPPRNHETERLTPEDSSKSDSPIETPVERSPIDSSSGEQPISSDKTSDRKPIGVILFRQQPAFSLFANRPSNPFSFQPSLFDHSHFHTGNLHDDPALRLISAILLGRRPRPVQPSESASESETVNTSSESSSESSEDNRRDVNPLESLFPQLFPFPRFPADDEFENQGETATNEEKTPANFENKEKKVINLNGRKFVKTTQVKKVKNDFGQFHSVISSYQPFDEKIHDENGNEKVKPENSNDEKVDKKDVESSTSTTEKIETSSSVDVASSTSSTAAPEREESTKSPELTSTQKEPEKLRLPAESLSKEQDESKNEIPDKNVEIKVDQMN